MAELPFFEYRHIVCFEETNFVGNAYFAHYIRWQGHCRELFIRERAPTLLGQLSSGLALVTVRCACEYFSELLPFDDVSIRMSLGAIDRNRLLLRFEYVRLSGPNPGLVASGEQEVACMHREKGGLVPTPVPAQLLNALKPYLTAGAGGPNAIRPVETRPVGA
ncbi:MAG TPA: acyl-CoA thioesterase [Gemmatimonadaceae bacterium]|nr:acyl-CoA thioesterase [Gemmatimonadaceae bacterium]